jgi:ketosteroid isomerase-like protein
MDADGLRTLLHPQVKHTAPGSDFGTDLKGAPNIVEYFRKNVFPSFHSVNFEVVFQYEDKDESAVIVEWRSHLKPKTGKNYSNTGAFVIEIKDGKIYWVRECPPLYFGSGQEPGISRERRRGTRSQG